MTEEERELLERVRPWQMANFEKHWAKAERKRRYTKMFNELCWQLNRVGLAVVAAGLRRAVASVTPLAFGAYDNPQGVGGWQGWLQSPLGVVAFVGEDGELIWKW